MLTSLYVESQTIFKQTVPNDRWNKLVFFTSTDSLNFIFKTHQTKVGEQVLIEVTLR